ncbi:hypothetical protein AHiyo1_13360 [Arthrobacter sp. Hiyo1]|nr:hypothetical protein AHiyo1_13360 [Arthrobacter sp. Hiyo1]
MEGPHLARRGGDLDGLLDSGLVDDRFAERELERCATPTFAPSRGYMAASASFCVETVVKDPVFDVARPAASATV